MQAEWTERQSSKLLDEDVVDTFFDILCKIFTDGLSKIRNGRP